jgi:ArsR family transcriptional regulator
MSPFPFPPFFKAISHPVRQKIMNVLYEKGEQNVNQLVRKLKLSQSTVSHHLGILKKAGVVKTREEGAQTYYNLCCDMVSCCCDMMKKFFNK